MTVPTAFVNAIAMTVARSRSGYDVSNATDIVSSALVGKLLAAWAGGGSLDGVTLQSRDRIVQATRVQIAGKGVITGCESAKALGFVVGKVSMGNHTAFGMWGTGGSLVFADSSIGLSFPLTKNRLGVSPWDKNSKAILVAETKSVLSLAK